MTCFAICYHDKDYKEVKVHDFVDSNWAGDIDGRWSTSGYIFRLFGGAFSWISKKQSVVALSTIKDEYIAATHASKEAVWLE
jgi:hypothetical protein